MKPPGRSNEFIIRWGEADDVMAYLGSFQRAAAQAYAHPIIDRHDLFSPEHFFHPKTMAQWQSMFVNNASSMWWVAHPTNKPHQIIGGIRLGTAPRFEGSGFYVDPEWQGRGIGRQLWQERQKYISGPLYFEVFSHAAATIAAHQKKGAAPTGKQRLIHWDSWPAGVNLTALEYVYEC